jgi:hypothetical protein
MPRLSRDHAIDLNAPVIDIPVPEKMGVHPQNRGGFGPLKLSCHNCLQGTLVQAIARAVLVVDGCRHTFRQAIGVWGFPLAHAGRSRSGPRRRMALQRRLTFRFSSGVCRFARSPLYPPRSGRIWRRALIWLSSVLGCPNQPRGRLYSTDFQSLEKGTENRSYISPR